MTEETIDTTPQPKNDWVVIAKEELGCTKAGLIIPDSATERYAVIVAKGPGRVLPSGERVPVDFEVGDRVMLCANPEDVGTFRWMGKDYAVVREDFLACVLPGDASIVLSDQPRVSLS